LVGQLTALPPTDQPFLDSYQMVAANSAFTRDWIRRLWNRDSEILHPPVLPQPRVAKTPIILGVGRFFDPADGHNKRQLELVAAFARLRDPASPHRYVARGWALHLVGGCEARGAGYLADVEAAAAGLPVHLHVNASGAQLRDLYSRAAIFWHATGLGEDEETHPERFEHFGITTVEAMSAGAVPVVIAKAGQLELFIDGLAGYHWRTLDELVERTGELMVDPVRRAFMADRAVEAAARFGPEAFGTRLEALVARLEALPAFTPGSASKTGARPRP
jgi:glycosyltransferase involved in cell wall biosynthesis